MTFIPSASIWFMKRTTSELNKAQDTYLLLLNDIDTEKRQELELRERAERDGLTGLYNARTAKMKINQLLADKTAPDIFTVTGF